MKNITLYLLISVLPICFGCSMLFSGATSPAFPVQNEEFRSFIGKRYKVIGPLEIKRYSDSWTTFLSKLTSSSDEKVIARVPVGSVIVIDHVSKSYNFVLGESYWYIARLENSAIYKGKFIVDYLMIFEKGDFVGMDSNYLVEI